MFNLFSSKIHMIIGKKRPYLSREDSLRSPIFQNPRRRGLHPIILLVKRVGGSGS